MTEEQAHFIQDAMYSEGYDCEVRDDYSGRGMYGRSCHGVVVDSPDYILSAIVNHMKQMDTSELDEVPEVDSFRTDNMGMSYIVY
jgi:hypothetical protein